MWIAQRLKVSSPKKPVSEGLHPNKTVSERSRPNTPVSEVLRPTKPGTCLGGEGEDVADADRPSKRHVICHHTIG